MKLPIKVQIDAAVWAMPIAWVLSALIIGLALIVAAGERGGRYEMVWRGEVVMRLDRLTGEVRYCRPGKGGIYCRPFMRPDGLSPYSEPEARPVPTPAPAPAAPADNSGNISAKAPTSADWDSFSTPVAPPDGSGNNSAEAPTSSEWDRLPRLVTPPERR